MTPRCQICGEFQSENTDVIQGHDVCYDCLDILVENAIERNGGAYDELDADRQTRIAHLESENRRLNQLVDDIRSDALTDVIANDIATTFGEHMPKGSRI